MWSAGWTYLVYNPLYINTTIHDKTFIKLQKGSFIATHKIHEQHGKDRYSKLQSDTNSLQKSIK